MTLPDLSFYDRLAAASSTACLQLFRSKIDVVNKLAIGFDPVTEADRNVETALRSAIEEAFPSHGIVGEEFGEKPGDGVHQWVIDPIDGTRAFISGLPVWGVLAGLLVDGRAVSGMMYQPYTGELYCGDGTDAWLVERGGKPYRIHTRSTARLDDATLFTTSPHLYGEADHEAYRRVETAARLFRYGCDCYAFAMLAAGHADIVIEPGLQTYDICGLIALIENSGGMVTKWDGGRPESGGHVVASANAALHEQVLCCLNKPV